MQICMLQTLSTMVVECTKPRGPIGAMFGSPGPSYGLPGLTGRSNHDPSSRFVKAPAYHFGPRWVNDQPTPGPGPCYMPLPKVWADTVVLFLATSIGRQCYAVRWSTNPERYRPTSKYIRNSPSVSLFKHIFKKQHSFLLLHFNIAMCHQWLSMPPILPNWQTLTELLSKRSIMLHRLTVARCFYERFVCLYVMSVCRLWRACIVPKRRNFFTSDIVRVRE